MSDKVTEFGNDASFLFARSREAKGYMLVTCCKNGNARYIADVDKCSAQEILAMLGTVDVLKQFGLDVAGQKKNWINEEEKENKNE